MGMSKDKEIQQHPYAFGDPERGCCWSCGADEEGWCDEQACCKHCGEFQAY